MQPLLKLPLSTMTSELLFYESPDVPISVKTEILMSILSHTYHSLEQSCVGMDRSAYLFH